MDEEREKGKNQQVRGKDSRGDIEKTRSQCSNQKKRDIIGAKPMNDLERLADIQSNGTSNREGKVGSQTVNPIDQENIVQGEG